MSLKVISLDEVIVASGSLAAEIVCLLGERSRTDAESLGAIALVQAFLLDTIKAKKGAQAAEIAENMIKEVVMNMREAHDKGAELSTGTDGN